jgi:TetR/AcrR family transcriptional repressor of uid operon
MSYEMSLASLPASRRPQDVERRERILEGAERAFVRHGFHAATMQLCEVDQAGRARAFAELMADKRDITEALCAGLRRHVLEKPPEKARLIVEIWAEAGRNPRVAALSQAIDADVLAGIEKLMDAAKAAGAASPRLDSHFGARFFFTFVAGLFKRKAIEPDFDPEAEAPVAIGVLKALFAGKLSPAAPDEEV